MYSKKLIFNSSKILFISYIIFTLDIVFADSEGKIDLKFHHFLSTKSTAHKAAMLWKDAVETESKGKITVTIYPSMQLGGKPPQLLDQVQKGIADVVWTLTGYTPGRYERISVFELPFMVTNAEKTSQAIQKYYEKFAKNEFSLIKPLIFHAHNRGIIHSKNKNIENFEDFKNKKIRAPNRYIGETLASFGATPIFMPVPSLPDALAKGVVDSAVIPWEVALPLKVIELAPFHTEIEGDRGLYTAIFIIAMNKETYEELSAELKKVIDNNSGVAWSKKLGQLWDQADKKSIALANNDGNSIKKFSQADIKKMKKASTKVISKWIENVNQGQKLFEAANQLLDDQAN